jgi:hypothetical protein
MASSEAPRRLRVLSRPRDTGIARGGPGWSSACSPRSVCFSQRRLKLLDRVIAQLRTGVRTRNPVRSTGMFGELIAKLGV